MTVAFAIFLPSRDLYADTEVDWAGINENTVRFDTPEDAERFRREFIWEDGAVVVPLESTP